MFDPRVLSETALNWTIKPFHQLSLNWKVKVWAGNTNWRVNLSTVDLLIKVACFIREKIFCNIISSLTKPGNTTRGKYYCTVDLLFGWFGISCMTTDNCCFYLQNRLIQTSQTGGQQYSNTTPLSVPWLN